MKRLLKTRWFTVATGILLALSSFLLLYTSVPPFKEYGPVLVESMPGSFWLRPGTFGLETALVLLALSALLFVLYSVSIWLVGERLCKLPIHRCDYFYAVLLTVTLLVLLAEQLVSNRSSAIAHLFVFGCGLVLFVYVWTTTLVRICGRSLTDTIYWTKVLRAISPRTFTGIFIVAAVGITTLVFLANSYVYFHEIVSEVYYLDMQPLRYLEKYILSICAPVVVLVVINVLCRSIIRLSLERERIAEEKLAAERFRAELITNVTHDIRTPLTSIINYVDLIDKLEIQDVELREYVAVLKGKSVRLKSLVNDLLDASKASTGNMEVTVEVIDLSEAVGQVVGGFDDALLAADLTYVNPDANRPIAILADGRHLYRVLENLFANVVKYAMPGTRVYIAAEESAQQVALSIKNTSKDELNISAEELLQQFVRGEQSRSAEGNGLGLFIAEHLTRLMGAGFALSINADLFEVNMVFPKPSA